MITHDLIDLMNLCALVASGILGSLIAGPLIAATKLAAKRIRISDRDR